MDEDSDSIGEMLVLVRGDTLERPDLGRPARRGSALILDLRDKPRRPDRDAMRRRRGTRRASVRHLVGTWMR